MGNLLKSAHYTTMDQILQAAKEQEQQQNDIVMEAADANQAYAENYPIVATHAVTLSAVGDRLQRPSIAVANTHVDDLLKLPWNTWKQDDGTTDVPENAIVAVDTSDASKQYILWQPIGITPWLGMVQQVEGNDTKFIDGQKTVVPYKYPLAAFELVGKAADSTRKFQGVTGTAQRDKFQRKAVDHQIDTLQTLSNKNGSQFILISIDTETIAYDIKANEEKDRYGFDNRGIIVGIAQPNGPKGKRQHPYVPVIRSTTEKNADPVIEEELNTIFNSALAIRNIVVRQTVEAMPSSREQAEEQTKEQVAALAQEHNMNAVQTEAVQQLMQNHMATLLPQAAWDNINQNDQE